MKNSTTTDFTKRCDILGDFWVAYRDEESFHDFFRYNALGLSLAFVASIKLVTLVSEREYDELPTAEDYINETWDLFLAILEIEDEGFDTLEDIMPTEPEEEE